MDELKIEETVRSWVETVVIGLNLCPFAKREMSKDSIRFVVSTAQTDEDLLLDLHAELQLLTTNENIETTLIIHPGHLNDFYTYNDFLTYTDVLLEELDFVGVFQIANFHPYYQFAGTSPDDPENYTNRSPYPILHILREKSVDMAIEQYPDTSTIPRENIRLLRELGSERMKVLLRACFPC